MIAQCLAAPKVLKSNPLTAEYLLKLLLNITTYTASSKGLEDDDNSLAYQLLLLVNSYLQLPSAAAALSEVLQLLQKEPSLSTFPAKLLLYMKLDTETAQPLMQCEIAQLINTLTKQPEWLRYLLEVLYALIKQQPTTGEQLLTAAVH